MKRKGLCILLTIIMTTALLAGCGSKNNNDTPSTSGDNTAAEGKVLNIYCWNEEFKSRVTAHYPGYTEVDATNGTIGDVAVKWHITPNENNAYQNNLDDTLLKQSSAAADDKIDIFLIEADYALKYVDTDYTKPITDLGITNADLANQYQYTKDIVTDSNGVLKGVSWQACPGVMFYNREMAKEVFGSDDPADIQPLVESWAKFEETANTLQASGYKIMASAMDSYRTYSNNVTSKWVVDDKINIDENIMNWVESSKKLVDAGQTETHDLWGADWSQGFYPDGKVFCYFGPAWFVNFSMAAASEGSIGNVGGWAATEGPQGFYWGGTWICAAEGTDNASTIKDIILKLAADETIMKEIVEQDDDFVNNKPAMEAMATSDYTSQVLGGQNPLPMYCENAETINLSNLGAYDQGCNEEFQKAMKNYFDGNATLDEALDLFYKAVVEKYPNLSY